jgi:hypothetical protein
MSCLLRTNSSRAPKTKQTRGSLPPIALLWGGVAFLLVAVLPNTAASQGRKSSGQQQAPTLLAPASGATLSSPDSLRFRWRLSADAGPDLGERYRRVYQRLLVTPEAEDPETEGRTDEDRPRVVRTYPGPQSGDSSRTESSSTDRYPAVGDWYPDVEGSRTAFEPDGVREARLLYPTAGDWYPGASPQSPLPNGSYQWEVHLLGETRTGTEEVLVGSRVSTFTVEIEVENAAEEEQSPSPISEVPLDLFDLRLTGRAAEARLTRVQSPDDDRSLWQIEIQSATSPVTLRWNRAAVADSFPDRPVQLRDGQTSGNVVDVDMKENETAEITNSNVRTLQVRPEQVASTQPSDEVTLTLMPKAGAFLSGVSSFGDVSGEAGSALGGEQSVLSWGGSVAFGSRNGTVNARLTGLRTTGSLVSTSDGVESAEDAVPNKLLLLTGDLILRPIPRFLVQPYAIGGAGTRRLSATAFAETSGEERTTSSWDPTVQVGGGVDLRLGNVTLGLEVVDYLTGITGEGGLKHDAFVFVTLGVPIY